MEPLMHNVFFTIFIALSCISGSAAALLEEQDYNREKKQLILELYGLGVLDFENFQDPSLPSSNYYVNFRNVISYPDTLKRLITLMEYQAEQLSFESVCGVPYAAIPYASNLACKLEKPLLMRRVHRKKYGKRKKIEGVIVPHTTCLVVEDVVCGGTSTMETVDDLLNERLNISDCIVVFDRQQGGVEYCAAKGVAMHPLFTIGDFMSVLEEEGVITFDFAQAVIEWAKAHQMPGYNWRLQYE